jgi:hypothetical protein
MYLAIGFIWSKSQPACALNEKRNGTSRGASQELYFLPYFHPDGFVIFVQEKFQASSPADMCNRRRPPAGPRWQFASGKNG